MSILQADIDISRDETSFSDRPFILGTNADHPIVAVVPGDFNVDSQMDVLVMRRVDDESTMVKVEIYSGSQDAGACKCLNDGI